MAARSEEREGFTDHLTPQEIGWYFVRTFLLLPFFSAAVTVLSIHISRADQVKLEVDQYNNDIETLAERMTDAYRDDRDAVASQPPRLAIAKLTLLPEVIAMMHRSVLCLLLFPFSVLSALKPVLFPCLIFFLGFAPLHLIDSALLLPW